MDLPVTVGMQEHPVVRRIAAAVGPPDDVMVMPSRQSGNFLMADGAETVLLSPEVQHLPPSLEIVCHLHAQAFLEVHFPLGGHTALPRLGSSHAVESARLLRERVPARGRLAARRKSTFHPI